MKVPPGGSRRRCQAWGLISGSHVLLHFPWCGVGLSLAERWDGKAGGMLVASSGCRTSLFRAPVPPVGTGLMVPGVGRVDPMWPPAQGGVQLVSDL